MCPHIQRCRNLLAARSTFSSYGLYEWIYACLPYKRHVHVHIQLLQHTINAHTIPEDIS